ncbi:hypothetical protein [Algibacter sp. PT7-4]|uniref:hypothetical protein n=1 Tax=Algibacter ulvanivorans TaxID=3400999 RepID=UPI003AAF03C6
MLEFLGDDTEKEFTKNDIWHSDYASEIIPSTFNKPALNEPKAKKEYNKFFNQPLRALAYGKVLELEKRGTTNYFKVLRIDILNFIASRERNAIIYLNKYLQKIIADSSLTPAFDDFFEKQNKNSLNNLRHTLHTFLIDNTGINRPDEPPRIYNKIINILAFNKKVKGTIKGSISKIILPIEEIRYNRVNWRDVGKDKSITRQEFSKLLEKESDLTGFYKYSVQKAKKFVRKLHQFSEIHRFEQYPGLQAHHIFMESEFPQIADSPENIIVLTPNQHFYRAHPNNKTSVIDKKYQTICLISKLDSIEINNRAGQIDYSLEEFVNVLNVGFETDYFNIGMDYEEIKHQIMNHI